MAEERTASPTTVKAKVLQEAEKRLPNLKKDLRLFGKDECIKYITRAEEVIDDESNQDLFMIGLEVRQSNPELYKQALLLRCILLLRTWIAKDIATGVSDSGHLIRQQILEVMEACYESSYDLDRYSFVYDQDQHKFIFTLPATVTKAESNPYSVAQVSNFLSAIQASGNAAFESDPIAKKLKKMPAFSASWKDTYELCKEGSGKTFESLLLIAAEAGFIYNFGRGELNRLLALAGTFKVSGKNVPEPKKAICSVLRSFHPYELKYKDIPPNQAHLHKPHVLLSVADDHYRPDAYAFDLYAKELSTKSSGVKKNAEEDEGAVQLEAEVKATKAVKK